MNKNPRIYNIIFYTIFLTAFIERTIFDLGPNVELLTSAMVLASLFLGGRMSFWLTFLVIAFSDRLIGNSKIFLFTWSGFLIPALLATPLLGQFKIRSTLFKLIITSFSANIFFFIWTNLGVWLLDSWGMYTKDLFGLIRCFINGLPFLKNQLVSSLIFIPAGLILIEIIIRISMRLSSSSQKSPAV